MQESLLPETVPAVIGDGLAASAHGAGVAGREAAWNLHTDDVSDGPQTFYGLAARRSPARASHAGTGAELSCVLVTAPPVAIRAVLRCDGVVFTAVGNSILNLQAAPRMVACRPGER